MFVSVFLCHGTQAHSAVHTPWVEPVCQGANVLSALLAVSHRSKTQQSLPTMESDTATYCGTGNHQHTLVYTVRYCLVSSKDGSRYKCLDPQPPLLISSALGQSSTRCNKVIKTPGGKNGNQTPSIHKWLPLLEHYFPCVWLVESSVPFKYIYI